MVRDRKIDLLKSSSLFSSCSKKELIELAGLCMDTTFSAGEHIVTQGATGREFFAVVDGSVDIIKANVFADSMTAGPVGELALLTRAPRAATVIATSPVKALVFSEREFHGALLTSPALHRAIQQVAGARDL